MSNNERKTEQQFLDEFVAALAHLGKDGKDYEILTEDNLDECSVVVLVSNPDRQPNSTRPLGAISVRWDAFADPAGFVVNTDDDEDQGFSDMTPTQAESFSLGLQLAVRIAEALNGKYASS